MPVPLNDSTWLFKMEWLDAKETAKDRRKLGDFIEKLEKQLPNARATDPTVAWQKRS